MSFLEKLQEKKNKLNHTVSIVTQPDGRQYVENNTGGQYKIMPQNRTFGFVVDTKPDLRPAMIISHLYVGSQDCCERCVLDKYNIKCVLSVGVEAYVKYENILYEFVECLDLPETDIRKVLTTTKCIPFISQSIETSKNVLVHCNAGCSRAPTIVIGYLILKLQFDFETAYNQVKASRPCIQPNSGFLQQLQKLEFKS